MSKPDLTDQIMQANSKQSAVVSSINTIIEHLSDDEKLAVFRNLMLEQICILIDKFPQQTQKEIMAIMADKHLNEWATVGIRTRKKS